MAIETAQFLQVEELPIEDYKQTLSQISREDVESIALSHIIEVRRLKKYIADQKDGSKRYTACPKCGSKKICYWTCHDRFGCYDCDWIEKKEAEANEPS